METKMSPGKIKIEDAYAQGKMLDHSGWNGKFKQPNGQFSDVDWIYDSGGYIAFGELKYGCCRWDELPLGQLLLFKHLVRNTDHVVVLCSHSTPAHLQIDTYNAVEEYAFTFWRDSVRVQTSAFNHPPFCEWFESWNRSPREMVQALRSWNA
jgi:hypothetical protein